MKKSRNTVADDDISDDDLLRIQVTIRRSTRPELYEALTATRAGRFASVRICQLAQIGLGLDGHRRREDYRNAPRRIVDIAASKTKKALTSPTEPVKPVTAIDC